MRLQRHLMRRAQLPSAVREYLAAGNKLMGKAASPKKLHRFHGRTERLRYAIEMFRSSYGPTLERRLALLRAVQALLDDINNCASAERVAGALDFRNAPQYRKLKAFLHRRSARLTAAFVRLWKAEFQAEGREDWWIGYLSRKRR